MKKKRIIRKASAERKAINKEVREKAMEEFGVKKKPQDPNSVAAQLLNARKAQKLSWYAVAQKAGIPNPVTVKDAEEGNRDVRLSNIEAIAKALGLSIKLEPEEAAS